MEATVTPPKKIPDDKRKLLKLSIPASPMMTKLGFGTGVVVYKMERSPLMQAVQSPWALKKVTKTDNKELNHRLKKEAQILCKLNHPNIVGFRGFLKASTGNKYLAMEDCSKSLGDLIETRRDASMPPFDSSIIWRVAKDLSSALDYLHNDAFLLHADLKSYNVLVKGDFEICKLCDFGVSIDLLPDGKVNEAKLPKDFEFPGTPTWCAPEIMGPEQIITSKGDIYSFGLILWEMLSLEIPLLSDESYLDGTQEFDISDIDFDEVYVPRQRPALPDISFGDDYNIIIELFSHCTEIDYNKRPNAIQLCAIVNESTTM